LPDYGLDFNAASSLAVLEQFGDWYRDPWGWPELGKATVEEVDPDSLLGKTDSEIHLVYQPYFQLIEVPKTRLGVRPAVVQDPLSRLAYLAAATSGLSKLHGELPYWVYGWRMREGPALADNGTEWRDYAASLAASLATAGSEEAFGLLTDITSFFASIESTHVEHLLRASLGKVAAANIIMDVVRAHDILISRSGLPQRSFASSIIAHAILRPVDDIISSALETHKITAARRWMDDISAEGSEGSLYTLLLELQEACRQIGLEINASKTHLAAAKETAAQMWVNELMTLDVQTVTFHSEYTDEDFEVPDLKEVLALEARILQHPLRITRTLARAVLVALTRHKEFSREEEWRQATKHLPHVADNIGRYLRGAAEQNDELWPELSAWFSDFAKSPWGTQNWVVAQLGLIFPSSRMDGRIIDIYRGWLNTSDDVQKVAIATQRLCSARALEGRTIVRQRLDRTADPLLLRLFALGLLTASENEGPVSAVLRRDPRNSLLLTYLEKHRWTAPKTVDDFDPEPS
jgi:hypothetical protein